MHGTFEHIFGWKITTVIAGLVGGLVSLSFIKKLTPWQAVASVFTGAMFAVYAAPAAGLYFGLSPQLEALTAFLFGLTAMNLIPAILETSKRGRCTIMRIISFFQQGGK